MYDKYSNNNMKIYRYISRNILRHYTSELKKVVENDAKSYFASINSDQYNLPEQLEKAIEHIKSIENSNILYKYETTPEELLFGLKNYIASTPIPQTEQEKSVCGRWVKKIIQLSHYLISIPKGRKIRSVSEQTISKELNKAIEQKERIIQLKEQEEKEQSDSAIIHDLESALKEKELLIERLKKEKSDSKEERMVENEWDGRIIDSFEYLKEQTENIETRKSVLDAEYHLFLYVPLLLIILLIVWFCKLYAHLIGLDEPFIETYTHLLPFYIPIPIIGALFWVCIVQKNRVSKLIIALEEELFHIRYQQGLLMAINKLSLNPEEAVNRINHTLDIMMNSYLKHTEHFNSLTERIYSSESKSDETKDSLHTIQNIIETLKK